MHLFFLRQDKDTAAGRFKRVDRLCPKVRKKQHRRLYADTSAKSCNKKRPQHYNHIWSYDFLTERLEKHRRVRLLVAIDKYTQESPAIDVTRNFSGWDVVDLLRYLFVVTGRLVYIRNDNGPESVSNAVKKWLEKSGVETRYANRELFLSIDELGYVVNRWRMDYNHYRPHSSL